MSRCKTAKQTSFTLPVDLADEVDGFLDVFDDGIAKLPWIHCS